MPTRQEQTQPTEPPFKFKELKVYNSTEYLWENAKKYRQVFDRYETAYIYTELSLINKFFDVADWSLRVELKCFSTTDGQRTEVCTLTIDREISKFDNVIYLREGWGHQKKGTFWKRGTYFWEASVDGQKIGSKYFYIVEPFDLMGDPLDDDWDQDDLDEQSLQYLELISARLYEGPYDDVTYDDRLYLKAFSAKQTRYIYLEMVFRNLQPAADWHLELFTKFHNEARELKGQVVRLIEVKRMQDEIRITAGWGATNPNLWRANRYTADVIFMDQLIATVPFVVGDETIPGPPLVQLPGKNGRVITLPTEEGEESFDQIMARLDALTGLHEVKQQVRDHAVYIRFLQLRQDRGFAMDTGIDVHSVFIGNPGTGKTTVARMMGKLYKKMGLLSKGHTVVADRVDLVGEYIGQTAPKTRDVIDRARGGVLFIDEAYALARSNDDGKDFGREVIEILVKEMSNGEGDLAVIVAGYPEEMKRFMDSNTGLKSRFKHNYDFRDFLPQELSTIVDYAAEQQGLTFTLSAKARIDEIITKAFRARDRSFGNARYVHDLVEKAKVQMALRLMGDESRVRQLSKEALRTVRLADVNKIAGVQKKEKPSIPVNQELLEESLAELDALIGMENVKRQIRDLVSLVRYYRQINRDVLNSFHLHTVLIGNPGTGKTTVARILAKLYNALGILERGHIVETDRQGMVAGYVGQTAEKTAKKVDEAIGGVLFIDEAYALTQKSSAQGDFGDEAIQTLLKRMEDRRGEFFVCVAGYPDNMDTFLKANPGLSSRFDKTLRFEDYGPAELMDIARSMFRQQKAHLTGAAAKHLAAYLVFLHKYRDNFFGNARTVRKIVGDIIRRHDLRRAADPEVNEKSHRSLRIQRQDVEHLQLDTKELSIQRKRIGF